MSSEAAQSSGGKFEPLSSPFSSFVILYRLFKLSKPRFLHPKKDNDTFAFRLLSVCSEVVHNIV